MQTVSDALRQPDIDQQHPVESLMSGNGSNNNLFDGLIRHDRLLTDSLVGLLPNSALQDSSSTMMPVVKTEHSYSMAGSDGDSIPDSPLSVNDTGEIQVPVVISRSIMIRHFLHKYTVIYLFSLLLQL